MALEKISRMEFIKDAAAGAMGVAAVGLLGGRASVAPKPADGQSGASPAATPSTGAGPGRAWLGPEPVMPESKIKQTWDTEVLVVGASTGGLFAACSAAEKGAKTIVIERNAMSAGVKDDLGAIDSKLQKAEGVVIDPHEIIADFVRYAGGYIDPWLENSAGTPGTRDKDWVTGHSPAWTKGGQGRPASSCSSPTPSRAGWPSATPRP